MKTAITLSFLACALAALPSLASAQQWNNRRDLAREDRHFLMKAAESSTNEVALSRLALERSQDPRIRAFARRMIHDHDELNEKLRDIAERRGVDIREAVDRGRQDDVDSLSSKSGEDFDRAYIDDMVKGHKDTIDLLESTATDSRDPGVAALAGDALPIVLDHYRHARALSHELRHESDYGPGGGTPPAQ